MTGGRAGGTGGEAGFRAAAFAVQRERKTEGGSTANPDRCPDSPVAMTEFLRCGRTWSRILPSGRMGYPLCGGCGLELLMVPTRGRVSGGEGWGSDARHGEG